MNHLPFNPWNRRRSALLGLAVDGNRLEGVVLRRTNGALRCLQSFSVALSLDPLTAAPELVGAEIRNHLAAAGVRERHCLVGLPAKWALVLRTELPVLPTEDVASFLQIEAERGFPCDLATLRVAASRCQPPTGAAAVTQVGISANHLLRLEQALRAARLEPVGFSLAITALEPPAPDPEAGVLALAIGQGEVDLQITGGGGVAALRALEGALEVAGGRRTLRAEAVAREVRITLGQLPPALRDRVRRVRVFGPRDLAQPLVDEMTLRLEPAGLEVELVTAYAHGAFPVELPDAAPVSAAFSLAARGLAGLEATFEFLPPRVSPWEQWAGRNVSGRYRLAGAVAAAVILLVGGAFLIQQWQLVRLGSQWKHMSAKAGELDRLQQQIQQYRPWFDDSFSCLGILRQLTAVFPEDGAVSVKTIEIRNGAAVTCSGVARDNAALLRTLGQLRAARGVTDLRVDQIRGKSPLQFRFDFHWTRGGAHEN